MCSWGSSQKIEKFYKGGQSDTPWNKDLLWRYHVAKEHKQAKINTGDMPPAHRSPSKPLRMKMGITGTLIPDVTPRESMTPPSRHGEMKSDRRSLHTASGRRILSIEPNQTEPLKSMSSSRTSSSWTSSSSLSSRSSIRMEDVEEILANQSKLLNEKTLEEMENMRKALLEEAKKREEAEKKIHVLCEKLGIDEKNI